MVVLCDILFCFYSFLNNFFLLQHGWIALHYAAEEGSEEIVKILVERGSNCSSSRSFSFFEF